MAVSLGINPITWTNDDMPELGGDIPLSTCLSETRMAGYAGIELGGKFPREPAVLRAYVRAAEESKAFGEAHRVAVRWAEVDPSTDAKLTLARLERATGNAPKALALLDAVLKEDADSAEAHRLASLWSHEQRLASNR